MENKINTSNENNFRARIEAIEGEKGAYRVIETGNISTSYADIFRSLSAPVPNFELKKK